MTTELLLIFLWLSLNFQLPLGKSPVFSQLFFRRFPFPASFLSSVVASCHDATHGQIFCILNFAGHTENARPCVQGLAPCQLGYAKPLPAHLSSNHCMKHISFFVTAAVFLCCTTAVSNQKAEQPSTVASFPALSGPIKDSSSWAYFLQHLPQRDAPILDYRGRPVGDQEKHFAVISYDVGTRDLQQCADALMRLRAEYLFAQKRLNEISFHFVSGEAFGFAAYCDGKTPVPKGNGVVFVSSSPKAKDHASLRSYLDIVYTYASTISLADELEDTDALAIGTVVIKAGSPGHCFIIADEATTPAGEKVFKLVEGYTPAQTIYVLRNAEEPSLGCWHKLKKGPITTASYAFTHYKLKKFE